MAFKKGQSGNPLGKPRGARHKTTLAVQALLDGEAETITRKAVDMALAGDTTALRLCLERILPARKDAPVQITLPPIKCVADAMRAHSAILQEVSRGDIPPAEANTLSSIIDRAVHCFEVYDLEKRLTDLEKRGA